jgi:oxalate decarboxylase/phosphoglucose isomerase-like protein (cupin superfamily)
MLRRARRVQYAAARRYNVVEAEVVLPAGYESGPHFHDEQEELYIVAGGKDGYVGRDGRVPDDETSPRGPGFSGPAGAASS